MKSLTELLDMARKYADLTGHGALYLAPGVSTAEAHVAAWHAQAVQGGYSDPSVEAWRLAGDKGTASRAQALEALDGPGALRITAVDIDLVRKAIGDHEYSAAVAGAVRQAPAATAPAPGYLAPEHRGEWTDAAGKLFHRTADGAEHVGSWLTCDACNPVQAVNANADSGHAVSLADLRAAYDEAKRESEAAEEKLKAVKAKLQTQLSEATNGALRSALHVPGYQPITLTYGEAWTVDSKKLKAEQPLVYVQYAKLGSRWTLAVSKQGRQ